MSGWKLLAGVLIAFICVPCFVLLAALGPLARWPHWFLVPSRLEESLVFGTLFSSWFSVPIAGGIALAGLAKAKRKGEATRWFGVVTVIATCLWAALYSLFWFHCAHTRECMRM